MEPETESRLEEIAKEINNSGETLLDKAKRISYIPLAVYYGGVLRREYQKKFAEKIKWREKTLTTSNAVIFGLFTSAMYYGSGEAAGSFGNMDFIKNLENILASRAAEFLGTTSRDVLYSLSGFNLAQTLFRIAYSQATEKAIASFSILGAFANAGYFAVNGLLKRKKS